MSSTGNILEVRDLCTHFISDGAEIKAVDGISFSVEKGKTLGLVGESGSGKSVAAMSILRLINPPGKVVHGQVLFNGRDLGQLTDREMRSIRGSRIAMVFQEPMKSLNPVLQVGRQISEALLGHPEISKVSKREAWDRAIQASRFETFEISGCPRSASEIWRPEHRIESCHRLLKHHGHSRTRSAISRSVSCPRSRP